MSVYPFDLDDDTTLPRVDDNITETGQEAINALRDAVFNVQEALGVEPQGSVTTVANRLDAALNADGTIKASALASIGLVTLPITNNQVGSNAGIEESKLSLVHSTTDLYTLISANSALLNSLNSFVNATIYPDLNLHISGSTYLSDGSSSARHVLSHIDLNAVPSDLRDPFFTWSGLKDKDGNLRPAANAAQGLLSINDALVDHETLASAHLASAIDVNTDNFIEIPLTATTVQSALDYLDSAEVLNMGKHRATQHANAISKIARSESLLMDGYGDAVVPPTSCHTYLAYPLDSFPVDDLFSGDDVIRFYPSNSNYEFDAAFSQVKQGDIIRINYSNGLEAVHIVESTRFIPGSEWFVRINGVNLCTSTDGYAAARIDRPLYDVNTAGIFATASANARNSLGPTATSTLPSLVVADPRGAMALGLNFDPGQLNSTHYNLYLQLYPTGNPADKVINLPAIDVTGNAGATPGAYTINSVISATNDKLRQFGYNYRFIAFEYNGEFGIMLADSINNASFSIISGTNSGGTLSGLPYTNNVIGGGTSVPDSFDALGLGVVGANLASPAYMASWTSSLEAILPTKVIRPLKKRYAIVNGLKVDKFESMYLTTDGYWDGYVSSRNQFGTTVETTYTVLTNLSPSGIKPGKTIVVQPAVDYTDSLYNDVDYGRFIIKSVNFVGACGTSPSLTQITVLNSIHAYGSAVTSSGDSPLPVKLYFSYDSVGFNSQNLIDPAIYPTDYKRLYEVYLTETGRTFSHERARMPIQAGSGDLVNTSNVHIIDVSPKLRGYTDGVLGQFNKFVRLYILNYDSVTGEYDGYLGQRSSSTPNIFKTGQIVTGKKNVVTRFYDETNIDYIDFIFVDTASPGTSIGPVPGYVDIELFGGLKTDDELFLLATCEVNWDPVSGENIIQYVSDGRQFGSVDETDFTELAKEYISAADKYLHDSGVIRGLAYESFASNGELKFKGGLAIVNGKVVPANNQSVTIPQIRPSSTPLGTSVDWAICLDENGNLIPYPLTSSKQIYYATSNGINNYQIVSLTFNEIINERKDLCLIAIATVTIASITINNVSDARKFISGLDSAAPLVWSSNNEYLGNFYSSESLKIWLNNSSYNNNLIKLKGEFNITSNLDLTGLSRTTTFDGSESKITLNLSNSYQGIKVGSNVHLQNLHIRYITSGFSITSPPSAPPYTLLINGAGAIYSNSSNVSNVRIKNCYFESYGAIAHPPFINFEFNREDVLEDIIIENNTFDAVNTSSDLAEYQAAIAFVQIETSNTNPSILKNIFIKNNYSKKYHGIYVTRNSTASPGFKLNCIIEGNTVGNISYLFGSDGSDGLDVNYGLVIKNNFVKYITTSIGSVPTINSFYNQAIGNVLIEGNVCNWLRCQHYENSNIKSSLVIKNNNFYADDPSYLSKWVATPSLVNVAIHVSNTVSSYYSDHSPFIIEGNTISRGYKSGTPYGYANSIKVQGRGEILNNNLSGVGSDCIMWCQAPTNLSDTAYYTITGNNFQRNSGVIIGYIRIDSESTSGEIKNNTFDSSTVDNSNENIIPYFTGGTLTGDSQDLGNWSIYSNKNQRATYYVPVSAGGISCAMSTTYTVGGIFANTTGTVFNSKVESLLNSQILQLKYEDTGDTAVVKWDVPLVTVLPLGSSIYKAELYWESISGGINPSTARTINLSYQGLNSAVTASSTDPWDGSVQMLDLNITTANGLIKHKNTSTNQSYSILSARITVNSSSSNTSKFYIKVYFQY